MWSCREDSRYVPEMFGKRIAESRIRGSPTPAPTVPSPPIFEKSFLIDPTLSAFNQQNPNALLFLRVNIAGQEVVGLVDSGSSRTFLGPTTTNALRSVLAKAKLTASSAKENRVTTATGQVTKIRAEATLPITVKDVTKTINVCCLPTLALSCIL